MLRRRCCASGIFPHGLGIATAKTWIASPSNHTIKGPETSIVPIAIRSRKWKCLPMAKNTTFCLRQRSRMADRKAPGDAAPQQSVSRYADARVQMNQPRISRLIRRLRHHPDHQHGDHDGGGEPMEADRQPAVTARAIRQFQRLPASIRMPTQPPRPSKPKIIVASAVAIPVSLSPEPWFAGGTTAVGKLTKGVGKNTHFAPRPPGSQRWARGACHQARRRRGPLGLPTLHRLTPKSDQPRFSGSTRLPSE